MEAQAKYDFEASRPDELSFSRGARLYVTSKEDDGDWYHAYLGNQYGIIGEHSAGFVPATYIELDEHSWYREKFTRDQANRLMLSTTSNGSYVYPNGAFIIRKSESDSTGFALSVRCGSVAQHFKILKDPTNKFYIWPDSTFISLNKLVQNYVIHNVSGDPNKVIKLKEIHQEMCQALYDFAPANDEELQLRRGDMIKVLAKSDPNWWEGEVDGRKGFFPMNYVKVVS